MLITTTSSVEGRPVKTYLGIVTGECFQMDDTSEGPSGKEDVLLLTEQKALAKMTQRAAALGANAIVGVAIDVEFQSSQKYFVSVAGTAVVIP